VEGRASKPLTPLSSIRAPMGLTPFKGSRSILGGSIYKKHFFKRVKLCKPFTCRFCFKLPTRLIHCCLLSFALLGFSFAVSPDRVLVFPSLFLLLLFYILVSQYVFDLFSYILQWAQCICFLLNLSTSVNNPSN
jgi:hypothetical protein